MADYNAQTVFRSHSNRNTHNLNRKLKTTSVLFIDDTLYTGGDDGIFEWDVTSEAHGQIDTRPAAALQIINGTLIASGNPNAVFVVNGEPIGFEGPARHGSMVYNGEQLFLTDQLVKAYGLQRPEGYFMSNISQEELLVIAGIVAIFCFVGVIALCCHFYLVQKNPNWPLKPRFSLNRPLQIKRRQVRETKTQRIPILHHRTKRHLNRITLSQPPRQARPTVPTITKPLT